MAARTTRMTGILAGFSVGLLAGLAHAADPMMRIDLGGGSGLDVVLVKAGEFDQGSLPEEAGRGPDEARRRVRITRDYYIGRSSVTVGQWERFVAETGYRTEAETGTSGGFGWNGSALAQEKRFNWRTPGFAQTADHPVCLVTFPDAQAFCAWMSRKTRREVTLPTEAQWEFACRAGTDTPWHTGSGPEDCDRGFWHKGNAGNGTRPVDSRPPNPWGLSIGGNVSEWCLDWYANYPAGEASDPRQENPNLSDKPRRVLRGGSWIRDAKNTRSAARYRADPRSRNADIGFRIVCSAAEPTPVPTPTPVAPPTPKVEAEPGDPPSQQPVAPVPASEPAPDRSSGSSGSPGVVVDGGISGLLGGLFCLAVPILVVVLLFKFLSRGGRAVSTYVPADPPVPGKRRQLIRKTSDGFWIDGDWPVGTALRIHYVVNGLPADLTMDYRPGPDGQFVYTGGDAASVSVVPDGDDPMPSPAPLFVPPPVGEECHMAPPRHDSRPPRFPSAY